MNSAGYIAIGLICLFGSYTSAQQHLDVESCGVTEASGIGTVSYDLYLERLDKLKKQSTLRSGDIKTLPVVFHIFHHVGIDEFTQGEIDLLLSRTNKLLLYKSRRAEQQEYSHLRDVPSFQLCLATKDPDGNNTTGIIHYKNSSLNYADQYSADGKRIIFHSALGGIDPWNHELYINVYVASSEKILGWARNPLKNDDVSEDAVLLNLSNLSTDLEAYTPRFHHVLAHELGHFFGLQHVWGKVNDCEIDDGISDTPLQENPAYDCVSNMSCGSTDMYANFMNYTITKCSDMFTIEQASLMRKVLMTYRPQLAEHNFCSQLFPHDSDYTIALYDRNIYISSTDDKAINADIYIYDLTGRLLHTERIDNLKRKLLNKYITVTGIYIIEIKDERGSHIRKFFISN